MPRSCTICTHDEAHAINVALVHRDAYRHIASRYEVSTGALQRHAREHLPELLRRMSRHDRAEAAAFSEVHDRVVLAGPDVLDAYAVDVPLGGLGTVVVEAHDEDDPPPLVRQRGWPEVLSYDVRWVPVDPEQAETDTPDEAFRAARAAVRPRLGAVARAVAELAPGEVLDADGLPVNRYAL